MTPHATFLRLAAIAIDEPIAPADRARLERHVEECPACARTAAGYRADAAAIAALPRAILTERRGAAILDTVLRQPPRRMSFAWAVVVVALLALALLGSLWVGSELLRRGKEDDLAAVIPVPSESSAPTGPPAASTAPTPSAFPVLLGSTWSDAIEPVVTNRPIGRIEAVTAGGPGFVAVGRGCLMQGGDGTCEGIVWLSADGRTWDRAPVQPALDLGFSVPTSGPEMGMFDVAAGGPGIVAVGYSDRARMEATAWFSPDGVGWQRVVLGSADRFRLGAVTWSGEAFVVVGGDRGEWNGTLEGLARATARATVWTSADGLAWTRVPHTPGLDAGGFIDTMEDPIAGGMVDVTVGPGGLVAVGSACTGDPRGCLPAAWTSSDAIAWERVADLPAVAGEMAAVTAGDTGYVAVGRHDCDTGEVGGACPALVMTSADGKTWSLQPFGQDGGLGSIVRIGNRLFATATAPDGPVTLWTSPDGVTWSPAEVTGGPQTGAGGPLVAWHLAATADAAVWLGLPSEDGDPAAWVSPAE